MKLQITTRVKYWEMLEVLPPEAMETNSELNISGFLVGEPSDHRDGVATYAAYFSRDDEEFFSGPTMTNKEFALAMADDDTPNQMNEPEDANEEDQKFFDAVEANDEDIVNAGIALSIPVDKIEDAYSGQHDSDKDFAMEHAENIGDIDFSALPWPQNCIDWEDAARELMFDYQEQDGYYFTSNY